MTTYDSYLVHENDGASRFRLENGTGFILLERAQPIPSTTPLVLGCGPQQAGQVGPDYYRST